MEIKKLLFVTQFRELCYDALQSLLVLRDAALEHVVFVYVIERETFAMYRTGFQKSEMIKLREAANIRFIQWAETLFEQGMEVGVHIKVGNPVSQIIQAARMEEADLIVIGRSKKGLLEQLYSGSDVSELLRRAATPVLVYKPLPGAPRTLEEPFKNPLVAVDGSPASLRALDYLQVLCGILKRIDIIQVIDEKTLRSESSMTVQKVRKDLKAKLTDMRAPFEDQGIDTRAHIYIGEPAAQIELAAGELHSSMIVLGSSSHSAWVERWIGSTPRSIAEKSDFPTLIIPPEKAGK